MFLGVSAGLILDKSQRFESALGTRRGSGDLTSRDCAIGGGDAF